MAISVLMSIYSGTEPGEFSACLESVKAQTLLPSEVVVVIDGPVNTLVEQNLAELEKCTSFNVKVLRFAVNRGLGAALADGLVACQHGLIARVDTDDISVPERLETQYQHLLESPDISMVGGLLEEQYTSNNSTVPLIRPVPIGADEIVSKCRYRNPVNHPTVMFRREHVLQAGNYQSLLWFEDYFLWARLIMSRRSLGNLDKVLVRTNADRDYFDRRGGLKYLKQEIALTHKFREIGFHNILQSVIFICSRVLMRALPLRARSAVYARFLRARPATRQD